MSGLRLGVAGIGKMGTLHLQKALAINGVEVSGVFDPDIGRVQEVCKQYSVKGLSNLAELLVISDALIVASPTKSHYLVAKQAVELGVHVLVEKPLALSQVRCLYVA